MISQQSEAGSSRFPESEAAHHDPATSTSMHTITSRNHSCQTDPISRQAKGCQVSQVKPRIRSKAVNAVRVMVNAAVQTDHVVISYAAPPQEKKSSSPKKTAVEIPSPMVSPIKHMDDRSQDTDPDYTPSNLSFREAEEECITEETVLRPKKPPSPDFVKQRKYIVFEENLLQLFQNCPVCPDGISHGYIQERPGSGYGTMVKIRQVCDDCGYERTWDSQPVQHQIPLGNLMLSAAILFSGSQVSQVLRMLQILNVATYTRQTYQRHQREYLIPTVINSWKAQQEDLLNELRLIEGGVQLAGDCRNDSPGHSAKYGTYTLLEQTTKKVIDLQQVQSNEAGNSNACELLGFRRGMSFLTETHGLTVRSLVTDRHRSIAAFVRDDLKVNNPRCRELQHYNDVWHTAKGLGKKIIKIGVSSPEVMLWKKSIVNHVYYTAATAPAENRRAFLRDMWLSVDNHIHDVHEHDSEYYPYCDHVHLIYDRNKEWLARDTVGSIKLSELLTSDRVVKDIQNLTPDFQTSSLEAFHSLVVHFAPKHTHFGWLGQMARTMLAAMHHNENAARMQRVTRDGVPQYRICFPKYKPGQHTVRALKTDPTHQYAFQLMATLLRDHADGPAALRNSIQEIRGEQPPPLAAAFEHPDKADAVEQHLTRFR